MKRVVLAAALSVFSIGSAWAQDTCESQAITKEGQPLVGAARASFLRLCRQRACEQPDSAQASPPPGDPVPIKTGIVRTKRKGNHVAPLKIDADAGNYLIKIVEKSSNAEVMLIFVGANQTFETKVALGTYKMRGASGNVWYGEKHFFGPCTNYFELRRSTNAPFAGDDAFQFTLKGRTYKGHHIVLQKAVGGNLETQPIAPGDF
jgi:hypothetical protein